MNHYNDQCDILYGRIRRLTFDKPEALAVVDSCELVNLGLDVRGLGVSGYQVQIAFDQVKEDLK